jgi:uncharacterized protein with LGFP repeats
MIGNFTRVAPPAAMMNAMADLYAWKLGSYYRNPTGKTVLTAGVYAESRFPAGSRVTFNTISGHRDADLTDCPGNSGYAMLPTLRTMVAARLPRSVIASRYAALGGPAGPLGEPILSGERAVPYGLITQFQNGSITYASATGARMLGAAFTATYLKAGGPAGALGFPINRDEAPTADGRGRYARFQRGFIHFSAADGAHETHGAIADRYAQLGYETGTLGYPQIDTTTRADGIGRYNRFDNGYIFFTPYTGAHEVYGPVLDHAGHDRPLPALPEGLGLLVAGHWRTRGARGDPGPVREPGLGARRARVSDRGRAHRGTRRRPDRLPARVHQLEPEHQRDHGHDGSLTSHARSTVAARPDRPPVR